MLWFKKKRKKVHRATGPIFKNQLTRTKVFFIPGLNIDISPEMAAQSAQRNQAFCFTASDWSQFPANQHETNQHTNQHKSAALIGLFHATSSVLLSVERYRNYRKPTQRGVQGYLSSLQRRVGTTLNRLSCCL